MMNLTPTTILLASDGAAPVPIAAQAASDLARWFAATLYVVQVARSAGRPMAGASPSRVPAYCALAAAVAGCTAAGGLVTRANLRTGDPEVAILAEAAEVGADLIVFGRRANCPGDETAARLARHAPCPVLLVRAGGERCWPPTTIVIGDDGSVEARDAGVLGAIIGGAADAAGLLLRSVPPLDTEEQRHAESQLLTHAAALTELLGRRPAVEVASLAPEIALRLAAETAPGPALITIGTCGSGAMGRLWLGSTANRVLADASAAVLICPPRRESAYVAPHGGRYQQPVLGYPGGISR